MNSLRAELLGETGTVIPPYRMLIPAGWEAHDLSAATEGDLLGRADARLRSVGNTALGPLLRDQVRDVFTQLRARGGFAYAFPGEASPTWAIGAASLVGTKRTATPELTLDQIVQYAIVNHAAEPIGDDHRVVRWTERKRVAVDGEDATTLLITYLIPIPGSRRTEAVQWTVTVAHDADMPDDHPSLIAWRTLFDVHVASFAWLEQ